MSWDCKWVVAGTMVAVSAVNCALRESREFPSGVDRFSGFLLEHLLGLGFRVQHFR